MIGCLDREDDVLASKLAVNTGEGVELVLKASSILGVQSSTDLLTTVGCNTSALAGDFRRENKVVEDSILNPSQCTAARSGLLSATVAAGLRENAALTHEHDVVIREFLLQLTGQPFGQFSELFPITYRC